MTGLEKILAEISGEAETAREAALEQARQAARELLDEEARQTETECAKITAQGEKDRAGVLARAKAGAELQKRQALLQVRQELIRQTLRAAGDAIITMPDEEYFESMLKVAAAYARPGEGVAYISERDQKRLPRGFEEKLNQAIAPGRSLKISPEPRPMYGGMILAYGGIAENCSLRSLFHAREERMLDLADQVLFG